jgi:hypothetical protein
MSRLLNRWFPSPEQQAEEARLEREKLGFDLERTREFLKIGYMADFRRWLNQTRKRVEPTVDEPGEMVYRTGMRDGVQLVIDRLEELEAVLRRRDE